MKVLTKKQTEINSLKEMIILNTNEASKMHYPYELIRIMRTNIKLMNNINELISLN